MRSIPASIRPSRSRCSPSTSRCRSSPLGAAREARGRRVQDAVICRPSRAASTTRCSLVQHLACQDMLDAAKVYVGVLAATILLVATNAGVIGASRITYAMASYRQLPEVFRRLHPRFKTPWLSLLIFAGAAPVVIILPGETNFLGTLYSFGATLSFTVAHASLVMLRARRRDEELLFRARPNLRLRGVSGHSSPFSVGSHRRSWLVISSRTRPPLDRARLDRRRARLLTIYRRASARAADRDRERRPRSARRRTHARPRTAAMTPRCGPRRSAARGSLR